MFVINPLPGQEEQNAEFIESNGLGYWLKSNDDIKSCLESFIDYDTCISNMKSATKTIARKNSTETICKILLEK